MKFENVKSWDDVLSVVDRDYFENPITEEDMPDPPSGHIANRSRGKKRFNFRQALENRQ